MNLSSENVKVFPIANRANNTLSEENVTFMNKSMYHGNGFAHSVAVGDSDVNCVFNILGYTFDVKVPLPDISLWADIFAGIKLTSTHMIDGQDSNGVYEGLTLVSSPDKFPDDGYTFIKIATKPSGKGWQMPGKVITVGNILRIDGKR
jgi:hypothetical protein